MSRSYSWPSSGRRNVEQKPDKDEANRLESAAAVAQYIAGLVGELSELARRHRLDALAYILQMARMEAGECTKAPATDRLGRADGQGERMLSRSSKARPG